MGKPWEKYQNQPTGKPWEKYQQKKPDEVINEDAPGISFGDRFIAKNFANSLESQAKYLQQEHPDMDVKAQGSDVLIKPKGTNQWRKLDADGINSIRDLTDVAHAIPGGIADAVGGALGATGGALAGPAGAVAGGIAGAGAGSAAWEGLRQKIGKSLGIPQDVNGKDVALAGAIGAGGAGLLGTGATKGLVQKTWQDGMPKAASLWFGPSEDVVKQYTNKATRSEIQDLAQGSKVDFADNLVGKIKSALNGERQNVGGALRSEIDAAGGNVDLKPIKDQYLKHISDLENQKAAMPNAINDAKLAEANSTYNQMFKGTPDEVPASVAFKLQEDLKDFGDLKRVAGGVNSRFASSATQAEKDLSNKAAGGYANINDQLSTLTNGASQDLKNQYRGLMDLQGNIAPHLKTDQAAITSFKNVDNSSKTAFKDSIDKLGKLTGQDFTGDMTKIQAADYFGSNSMTPMSMGGATSTSRTIPATALGGTIGGIAGHFIGHGNPMITTAGAGIGAAAGNVFASPPVLRGIISATDPLRAGVNAVGRNVPADLARPIMDQSAWDYLRDKSK